MQEHDFDRILDFLCSGIMSKAERQNVRDELFDHLMCKYETNIAMGMDDDEATAKAIYDLGDKTVIKHRLSQVHSYYPNLSMKKAMNLLILGFCLMSFQINIIINTGEITKFIGHVIMLVAMFCMSKANASLKKAFIFGSAEFALTKIAVAITPALPNDVFFVPHVLYIASCIANIVKWCYLFYGLRDLTVPFKEEYKKTIPFGFAAFVNAILPAYFIWIYSAMIVSENSIPDMSEVAIGAAYIFIPFALISIIITLVVFVRSSKCLWQNDHEYRIETSSNKKIAAALIAVAVAIVPMAAVDLWVSYEKAETEIYSIDDSDIPEDEYNRICGNLLSYGIPEKLVYSLPESEIEKFKSSDPFDMLKKDHIDRDLFDKNEYNRDDFSFTVYTCAVGCKDEYNSSVIRFMTWIEYSGDSNSNYSDYITMDKITDLMPYNYKEEYNGDLFLILSEENGKLVRNKPLAVYTDDNYLVDSISGVKFEAKDNLLIYYGTSYSANREEMYQNLFFRLYHRTFPLTSMRNPPKRESYSNDVIGYEPFTITTLHIAAFPKTEETE